MVSTSCGAFWQDKFLTILQITDQSQTILPLWTCNHMQILTSMLSSSGHSKPTWPWSRRFSSLCLTMSRGSLLLLHQLSILSWHQSRLFLISSPISSSEPLLSRRFLSRSSLPQPVPFGKFTDLFGNQSLESFHTHSSSFSTSYWRYGKHTGQSWKSFGVDQ